MPGHSYHHNHGLFSDNYLSRHLPELVGADLDAAREAQQKLRDIYAQGVPLVEGAREGVCEEKLIRPAMRALGFELDPQPPLPTVESSFTPDYALFAGAEDLAAVADRRGSDDYYARTLAVGEAKSWDRDLGSSAPGDAALRQHPGAQIRRYLLDANVRWGILTNGRLWRIYEREASRAGFRYYEVDLPALLDADVQDFRFFWLFFRRDAFVPAADGRCFVTRVLEESRQYWLDITSRLRDRVYDALEALMTGMIQGSPDLTPDDLPRVHEAALIVLYRLLFAFYAEARRLLPLDNATYRENLSVQTKLSEVARRTDTGGAWARASTGLWQWFRDLSRIINEGDPETGVPEYDGGLFDPDEWPLLADPATVVPDDAMAEVIDRLGRDWDRTTGRRAFLDYHELSVRELGSIYEGLLEMRPHRQEGRVVLLTDRGERKATGSYYTPEYIVDYIVTNTLDPLLKDAAARVAQRRPEIEAEIARRERLIAERGPDDPENAKTRAKIEDLKLELLEPYFELMVLDPAMGSGHFLVAASEEITEAIITDPAHLSPAGVAGVEDENLFFKRRVVERCLYGVDLNPLAVELAKLSLWLHTVEFGKPLSFLKHHLRTGNSLIGARLNEMRSLPTPKGRTRKNGAQLNLFTSRFLQEATILLQAFNVIEKMPTDTPEQKCAKDVAWADIEERRERFRQVANVWLSVFFGNRVANATYEALVLALDRPERFAEIASEQWFGRAQALAAEHRFFHWELEFPEAFFTEHGMKPEAERGFDAVVGNPPWGVSVGPAAATHGLPCEDSSEHFYARGLGLSRPGGMVGMVLPRGLLSATRAKFRRMLLDEHKPLVLADIGPDWFTRHVRMSTVLLVSCSHCPPETPAALRIACLNREQRLQAQSGAISLESAVVRATSEFDPAVVTHTDLVLLPLTQGPAGPLLSRMLSTGTCVGNVTTSARGVEMSKSGLIVRCPKCGLWNLPPRSALSDRPATKACTHCNNNFRVGGLAEMMEIVQDEPTPGGTWCEYIDGDAISRYVPLAPKFIDISRKGINYKPPETYAPPKVLIRETGVGLNAALDLTSAYCPRSVYVYRVTPDGARMGYDEAALVGVLLSRTMLYTVYNLFGETDSSAAFAKVRKIQVDHLPLPQGPLALLSVISECAAVLSESGLVGHTLEDWTLEGALFHLWQLTESDVEHMMAFFGSVHDNETIRAVFPQGAAGNEAHYTQMWLEGAERAERLI